MYCRTCLTEDSVSVYENISESFAINGEYVELSKMISCCTGLEILEVDDDNLTKTLCAACVKEIIHLYYFREKCWSSHYELLNRVYKTEKSVRNKLRGIIKRRILKKKILENGKLEVIPSRLAAKMAKNNAEQKKKTTTKTPVEPKLKPAEIYEKLKAMRSDKSDAPNDTVSTSSTTFEKPNVTQSSTEQIPDIETVNIEMGTDIYDSEGERVDATEFLETPDRNVSSSENEEEDNKKSKPDPVKKDKKNMSGVCPVCGITVKYKYNLETHMRIHTDERPFACTQCHYKARTNSTLKEHIETVHMQKTWPCEYPDCVKVYTTRKGWFDHIREHGEPRLECDVCKKKFYRPDTLRCHRKTHFPHTMLTCEFCDKKFVRNTKLQEHRMTHTGEFKYKCSVCEKGFIKRYNWSAHMKRYHNIIIEPYDWAKGRNKKFAM